MPHVQRQREERFTYGNYRTWPENERWELIDGVAYDMSPAPSRHHQGLITQFILQFGAYLQDKPCRIYAAPFDVRLPDGDEDDDTIVTVVQPDLVVVCDPDKLDEKGCRGAPDLVIEILSPSTTSKDLHEKFDLYERVGIKEYWIVHPQDRTVMVFKREGERFGRPNMFDEEGCIEVPLLGDLNIDLKLMFSRL